MTNQQITVAVYDTHPEADAAVNKLKQAGFDLKHLSIIGQDYQTQENIVGYYNIGDRMKKWGGMGAFWGGLWGMLVGSAFFMIPGFGPLLIAGPFAAALVGALEGAVTVGGISAVGAALASVGVAKDSLLAYETELKAGRYVLIAHGNADEVSRAQHALGLKEHTMLTIAT